MGVGLASTTIIILLVSSANLRGERVGFGFAGAFQGSASQTYSLFGVSVPRNSPVTGTFSYDSSVVGTDVASGVRIYNQSITGGYTLNINNGAIRLSASDYFVTVANDSSGPVEPIDYIRVDFDKTSSPPPSTPILVNGIPWSGDVGFIRVELSWPASTFTNPDEPKLTGDRPGTALPAITAWVGSALSGGGATPRIFSNPAFSISSLAPLAGDYNRDGALDVSDYTEWRRAFAGSGATSLYADGNGDAEVDAADYVIWRRGISSGLANGTMTKVPEPDFFGLVCFTLFALACSRRSRLFVMLSR